MASTPMRLLAASLFLLAVLLIGLAGSAIGIFINSTTSIVYQSSAVFQIAPSWIPTDKAPDATAEQLVELCDLDHEKNVLIKRIRRRMPRKKQPVCAG